MFVSSRMFPSGPVILPARIPLLIEKWRLCWIASPPLPRFISKSHVPTRASGRVGAEGAVGRAGGGGGAELVQAARKIAAQDKSASTRTTRSPDVDPGF